MNHRYFFLFTIASSLLTATLYSANGVPAFDHIVVVIEENHSLSQCINNPDMPYFNSLAKNGALFTHSYGWGHPSQPNYLALFSGSNHGITDNDVHTKINAPNLWSVLNAVGKKYISYSEDLPAIGSDEESSGAYARKHNPTPQFVGVPSQANQTFNEWPTDYSKLPEVSFVVPNEDNDAHDGTLAEADAWLKKNISGYADWAKNNNSLLIVTFDENVGSELEIPTFFYGANVKTGVYTKKITHYSVLRLMQDAFNAVPYLGGAASVASITDCWSTNTPPIPTDPDFSLTAVTGPLGDVNVSFVTKNWTSKSVQLIYSINNQSVQQAAMSNSTNTWTYHVGNLKNQDVVTYCVTYEWNGQTKQTNQQTITYTTQTPSDKFTQSVLMVDPTTAQITFKPANVAAFVDIHYTIDNGGQINVRMNNKNNTWTISIPRLELNDKIHYSFTYEQSGSAYDTQWFDYTVPGTNPTPSFDYMQTVQPLIDTSETQVNFMGSLPVDSITLAYAINGASQHVITMKSVGNNIWIATLPAFKCGDKMSYSFTYVRNGITSTTTPTFNYTR